MIHKETMEGRQHRLCRFRLHRCACAGFCVSPPMLVLEFMEGGDMWSALRGPHREELQWYGRGRSLALDIARGLHFLHEHKAGSLLLTPDTRSLSGSLTALGEHPGGTMPFLCPAS